MKANGRFFLVAAVVGLIGLVLGLLALSPAVFGAAPFSSWLSFGATRTEAPDRWRFGVGVPMDAKASMGWLEDLGAGWYLNWAAESNVPATPGIEYWPMVRFAASGSRPSLEDIRRIAVRQPGAHWLIGNEPDVTVQDNATPEAYAEFYQRTYTALKTADPTCEVGMGGIAQVSALRLAYLDRVLAHYQQAYGVALPSDFWGVHLYILREERGSWGAEIPPGLNETQGWLVDVKEHGQVQKLQDEVWSFRRWMKANGYGGQPLVVSEYGILMPADYGFPAEVVSTFMQQSFDFFLQAADPELGDPQDGYRLVQRWAWFSLAYAEFPASDLVDFSANALTPVGWMYRNSVAALPGPP